MSDLSKLAVGDPLVVSGRNRRGGYRRTVAKVGRVWLTDSAGESFRIEDGRDKGGFAMAYPEAEWDELQEISRLREKMLEWGWTPHHRGRTLTLGQLRRAVALLGEFEAEAGS
jgi:hypothetical protein